MTGHSALRNYLHWSQEDDAYLKKSAHLGSRQLARELGRTIQGVQSHARKLKVRIARANVERGEISPHQKTWWEEKELECLRRHFPTVETKIIAEMLGRSRKSVERQASRLGLVKSPEFRRALIRAVAQRRKPKSKKFQARKGDKN